MLLLACFSFQKYLIWIIFIMLISLITCRPKCLKSVLKQCSFFFNTNTHCSDMISIQIASNRQAGLFAIDTIAWTRVQDAFQWPPSPIYWRHKLWKPDAIILHVNSLSTTSNYRPDYSQWTNTDIITRYSLFAGRAELLECGQDTALNHGAISNDL